MKQYYYNPKTQNLTIFDTENKEMLVLERIEGIRALTSAEIARPKNFHENDPAGSSKREDYEVRDLEREITHDLDVCGGRTPLMLLGYLSVKKVVLTDATGTKRSAQSGVAKDSTPLTGSLTFSKPTQSRPNC